ncbi:hypothetical protein PAPYR_12416 [Paratrimastix pyriformis]|uniref:Secreted protein n=1 Tax=Paratrimastix pyriformis TaxID=342808 RepID=A0ABQ8U1Y5_9EUKA|nr:hypothetical protein PAPYR_12416 [Paratrimastix pyriformis]
MRCDLTCQILLIKFLDVSAVLRACCASVHSFLVWQTPTSCPLSSHGVTWVWAPGQRSPKGETRCTNFDRRGRSPSHSHFIYSFSHPGHFQFISQLHISPPSIRVGASFPECTFLISPPTRAQGPSTLVAHHPVLTVRSH